MEQPNVKDETTQIEEEPKKKRSSGCIVAIAVLAVLLVIILVAVRPGVFSVQPIGALPEGVTFIYHSRGDIPFFSSPDGMCLDIQGSVSLLCRGTALAAVTELTDRIII